jgi:hypothetical protein
MTDSSLSLPELIRSSQTIKARLLHYFPPSPDSQPSEIDEPIDSWCGFHLDHSLLTGLCSVGSFVIESFAGVIVSKFFQAMFLREDPGREPTVVPSPSPASGLYIRARGGDVTKVSIPANCLAFQTGEALELATSGKLRATPHCVRIGASEGSESISRETFALFMQPDTDQPITSGESFGQFSKRIFDQHYEQS